MIYRDLEGKKELIDKEGTVSCWQKILVKWLWR